MFEIRGFSHEFSNILRSPEQFIQTVKCQKNFRNNAFLSYSWRFFGSNTLEQLEFKFEKNISDLKIYAGKVRKNFCNIDENSKTLIAHESEFV